MILALCTVKRRDMKEEENACELNVPKAYALRCITHFQTRNENEERWSERMKTFDIFDLARVEGG